MENIIFIIILYFLGALVSDQAKRKKRRNQKGTGDIEENHIPIDKDNPFDFDIPPIKKDKTSDFKIPKLEGAPKTETKSNADEIYQEESKTVNPYINYLKSNNKTSQKEQTESSVKLNDISKESVNLTKDNIKYGIILAEILGAPKAHRRIRR